MTLPEMPPEVATVYDRLPAHQRVRLMKIRDLILTLAQETDGVGPLTETLKWGEPSYLTEISRSGTTIRLGRPKSDPEACAVFFNCRTSLVEEARLSSPDAFDFEGNRALVIRPDRDLPHRALALCLTAALTYHKRKKQRCAPAGHSPVWAKSRTYRGAFTGR